MSPETANAATLAVLTAPWLVWLAWEIYLLVRRGETVRFKTISMAARDNRYRLSGLVYLWAGMFTHWFWPGTTWATAPGSIIFWAAALALIVKDVATWSNPPKVFHPLAVGALGAAAGKLLFPQAGG